MAVTINIVKKSAAYTNMRIFRGTTKENVYAGPAIDDVAIASSYVDNTAVSGQVYFYGVELYHATDKTRFTPIRVVSLQDYGPLTTIVQGNIQTLGRPFRNGIPSLGIITYATFSTTSNIPAVSNMKTKMEELAMAVFGNIGNQIATDTAVNACILDGKIVIIPVAPNFVMTATSDSTGNTQLSQLRTHLLGGGATTYVDIAGYRWNIKHLTREMIEKYPEIAGKFVAGRPRACNQLIDLSSHHIWSDGEARANLATSSTLEAGCVFSYSASATTGSARATPLYYEYAGATP